MLTVYELREVCNHIIKEYGGDSSVALQLYDLIDNKLDIGCYAMSCGIDSNGVLFITNKPQKDLGINDN